MQYVGSPFLFPLWCSFSFQSVLRAVCGILVPWPGMKPGPRAWGACSLNRWTSSKVSKWNIQRYSNQERSRINEPSWYTDWWCSAGHRQEKHEGKGQLTFPRWPWTPKTREWILKTAEEQRDILHISRWHSQLRLAVHQKKQRVWGEGAMERYL